MAYWRHRQLLLRNWGEKTWLKKYGKLFVGHGLNLLIGWQKDYQKKMENRYCTKCNKICHCVKEDLSDCECENCECMQREEDKTYE